MNTRKNPFAMTMMILSIAFLASCSGEQNRQSAEVNTPAEVKEEQKATADVADVSFVDGMTGKAFHNYLQLQRALFNSDLDEAKEVARNLSETFTEERASLKELAVNMAEADDLSGVRTHFSAFTNEVEPLFSNAISTGMVYKQYCPMAFNNEGAYWIADVKEINNPYFGEQMPTCGETVATISK